MIHANGRVVHSILFSTEATLEVLFEVTWPLKGLSVYFTVAFTRRGSVTAMRGRSLTRSGLCELGIPRRRRTQHRPTQKLGWNAPGKSDWSSAIRLTLGLESEWPRGASFSGVALPSSFWSYVDCRCCKVSFPLTSYLRSLS